METYERAVRVEAPLERVWEFHIQVAGLEDLTPDWMGLRVEDVRHPEGDREPDVLHEGSSVRVSAALGGVGPRQRWTSEIVATAFGEGSAYFRDEMRDGPFPTWVHTHLFYRDGDGTLVRDRIRYELPGGGLGRRLGPLGAVGLAPLFRYRHRRTKALLEDG